MVNELNIHKLPLSNNSELLAYNFEGYKGSRPLLVVHSKDKFRVVACFVNQEAYKDFIETIDQGEAWHIKY